ncbi:hypothetical protein M9H77_35900 [Catharanthus roseus]|uniref:Uncharacterized protein n=1 Tax=Catharanthus roseus TaxID=4058 RepID=A0ACB9ZQL4_CATRO|nr:hypothetical protein M9H77_35900 [Catharanthus roseus]
MKAHFIEAYPSFWKVPDKMKSMWCIEFGKRYRWDPMHERTIRDAWKRRASLRYKDLMYEVHTNRYQPNWMTTPQNTSLWTVSRYTIRPVLGEELKANAECLHIETAAGGSNKGHVYGFGSQSAVVTVKRWVGSSSSMSSVPSVSSARMTTRCVSRGR